MSQLSAERQRTAGARAPDGRAGAWLLQLLIAAAMLLGGGGAPSPPLLIAAIDVLGVVILAELLVRKPGLRIAPPARWAVAFVGMLLLTILLQLLPLPPKLWQALPGRDISTQIRAALGLADAWFPFSLDPSATRSVGYALIPPIAAFLATLHSGTRLRLRLITIVVAIAALDQLTAALQFAARGQTVIGLWDTSDGLGFGLFANRNHNADFLLIAPLLAGALLRMDAGRRLGELARPTALGVYLFFMLGVLITFSRTGFILTILPLIGMIVLFGSRGSLVSLRPHTVAMLALALLVALTLAVLLALTNPVVLDLLGRFHAAHDQRLDFWPDVIYAIRQLWPCGSGSGTFDPMFRSVEMLDAVGPSYVNHAHDDYLELLLELGLWGALLIAAALALYAAAVARTFFGRRGRPLDPLATAAILSLAVLILHSLVDYPMRTAALGTLAGLLAGLTYAPASAVPAGGRGGLARGRPLVRSR